ncbi:MAG: 5-(carboxyamino)imidazole ribonucleotide synthase [Hyphomicrobiales bacterium]|nr:5-(carboxyamino)imidazole ribonucleotide synthase [Hyphomicrobiales bacterium]
MTEHPLKAPLAPGSAIGVLGAGQLGRMLAMAAARLGLRTHVYSDASGPAFDVAAHGIVAGYDDADELARFARGVEVVTYEFENVPQETAAIIERHVEVRPGPRALAVSQDRFTEKSFITGLGIPVAPFLAVDDGAGAEAAYGALGGPAILKARRFGYDGKGQASVVSPAEARVAFAALGDVPAVLERRLDFRQELSVLIVRGRDGAVGLYDIPQNTHAGGILRRSVVPAPLRAPETAHLHEIAHTIADALGYVGVLAVELFDLGGSLPLEKRFVVNEIAPRVHNSGHWTLDACPVSQFENHVRAVAGWPLGTTERHSDAEMANLIGDDVLAWRDLAADRDACVHLYGKGEARPGRKMGHVTRLRSR